MKKKFVEILPAHVFHAIAFFVVFFALKMLLLYFCYRHGMGFGNPDEVARVIFSKRYAETGDYSSFEYFWLPLPFMLVGFIGKLLNHEYYIATIASNTLWSFLAIYLSLIWILHVLSRRISGSPLKYWSIATGIGCVAIILPWQTIGSLSGFSEPLSWMALIGATTVLMRMEELRNFGSLHALLVGAFLAVANFSRYECWVVTVFAIPILVWLYHPTLKMNVQKAMQSLFLCLAIFIAVAPITFWMWVNQSRFGDPLRMFEFTHRFETTLTGESNSIATALSFLKQGIATNPLLPFLAILCVCRCTRSLKDLIQSILPLASLMIMVFSTALKGIPWMTGERTLALYCFWLMCPAFDFLTEKMSSKPIRLLGICLFFTIINLVSLSMLPLESYYKKQALTRDVVERLNENLPAGRRPKIAFEGTDVYEKAMYLVWPICGDFVPLPTDWNSRDGTAQKNWILGNRISLLLSSAEPSQELRRNSMSRHYPQTLTTFLSNIDASKSVIVTFTHGTLNFGPPEILAKYLTERGCKGPTVKEWLRYSAVILNNQRLFEGIANADGQDSLNIYVHARPKTQRQSLPGTYTFRVEPATDGSSTILQLGNRIFQPKLRGYYVAVIDEDSGKLQGYAYLPNSENFVYHDQEIPYFVLRFR